MTAVVEAVMPTACALTRCSSRAPLQKEKSPAASRTPLQLLLRGVQRDDSAGQRFSRRVPKAVRLEQLRHGVAARELFDRGAQIIICTTMASNGSADHRDASMQIESISRSHQCWRWQRKVQQ